MENEEGIGGIKELSLREVFERENTEFTPWLRDNIDLLGEVLIDSTIEEKVGNFSCDIVAKDSDSDKIVIIENSSVKLATTIWAKYSLTQQGKTPV